MHFALASILVSTLAAQSPSDLFETAPPHIDEALRARIGIFYQSHVDGKFRQADAVVHEDSKDAFFEAMKPRYKGYEIVRIAYAEDFAKARVVVAVDTDFLMPGRGQIEIKAPMTTLWKLDGGEWWWYLPPPEEGVQTPFGLMRGASSPESEAVQDAIASMPTSAEAFLRQIRVSKTTVMLSTAKPSSDEVVITNGMPGPVSLTFSSESRPGYEAKLERESIESGEEARILFHFEPTGEGPTPPIAAEITVNPTGQVIPIRVRFESPPPADRPRQR